MEYLPSDPNDSELKNIEKSEKKLKEFREYIVDKGVVLGLVKVLLSLKYAENKPKNPIKAIREFFGKYNDSRWDEMDVLKEEIVLLNTENPKLFEKVQALEEELEKTKRNKRYSKLFKSYEVDKNGQLGTKMIIEKLTGNKKFEVDEKLGIVEYMKMIENVSEGNMEIENALLSKLEESMLGSMVFKEDIENPVYKKLVQVIKDMKRVAKK